MNIITNSDVYAGLSQGHFLSSTGGCKTWDEGADGYCRSGMLSQSIFSTLKPLRGVLITITEQMESEVWF